MPTSRTIISPEWLAALARCLPWAVALALVGYAFVAGGYLVTVMSFALIYAVFVTGLNLFMGYAGQVTFGHNAFAALSGYASAVLTSTYGWQPIIALLAGLALALAVALLVGYPTLRLKGHYLAMATLAIGLIVYEVAVQWQAVTGGYMGISGIPPFGTGRFEIVSDRAQLAFTMLYVGGIGTAAGPLIGAVIISLLPETFRALKDYQDLAYGAGLILLLIYAPKGLAALGELMPRKLLSRKQVS
jgi:branched-chain amino acid transport system permease protein